MYKENSHEIVQIENCYIQQPWAKPIIDILVEIPKENNLLEYKDLIINNGYICMSQSENGLSFNNGACECTASITTTSCNVGAIYYGII